MFIKNIIDLQRQTLKQELEYFDLKPSIFYLLDSVMSLKKESHLDVNYSDPTLPNLVQGDLNKFKQILTVILDFAFSYSNHVKIDFKSSKAGLGEE